MTNQIIAYYLIIINIVTFLVYGIDKWKARKSLWRIREASLLMLAVLGGSIGAWLGMKVWHHKTQHKKFQIWHSCHHHPHIGYCYLLMIQSSAKSLADICSRSDSTSLPSFHLYLMISTSSSSRQKLTIHLLSESIEGL